MNGNQLPEIVGYRQTQADSVAMMEFYIYEWKGHQVLDVMDNGRFEAVGKRLPADIPDWRRPIANATGTTRDANGDGLYELVISGGLSSAVTTCETRFERHFTETWAWGGKKLQLADRTYDPPLYRFQRSSDGDLAFALNQLEPALVAYQDVLFDSDLYERDQYPRQLEYCKGLGSGAEAALRENERAQLSAYARWRILLINTLKDSQEAMRVVYNTLQEKFPPDKPGSSYAVIASAFWENYQSGHDLEDACAAANSAARDLILYPSHKADNICFIP